MKLVAALTPAIIDALPPPLIGKTKKLTDGAVPGLHMLVKDTGRRYWRLKYRLHDEEKIFSVGVYPEVGLEAARAAAREARVLVKKNVDPNDAKKAAATAAYVAKVTTFGMVGREFLDFKSGDLAPATARKLEWQYACLQGVHGRPIGEVTPQEVIAILTAIEAKDQSEAAHRVGQFAHRVFEFARARGYCAVNPIPSRRDILKKKIVTPIAAFTDPHEFGSMMRYIDTDLSRYANVRHGLQLIARVALRPGELRQALWSEIDLDKAEWRVPASRMKMRREHLVPLSRQAVEVLRRHKEVSGIGQLVFPGLRSGRPMSDAAMNKALVDMMVFPEFHQVHGFRSSFSTIMNENGHDAVLIELQLSHRKRDKVASIYDRSERVPERRVLMQAWSDLIDEMKARTP
jgi:integrase